MTIVQFIAMRRSGNSSRRGTVSGQLSLAFRRGFVQRVLLMVSATTGQEDCLQMRFEYV